jgi:uncharacterized protein
MYPKEYIDYLVHFHGDRDYFECHEVLEDYWKKVDKNNKRSILVGFILLAVSNYHHRRGNFSGAHRTLRKALNILNEKKLQLTTYGFSPSELIDFLDERLVLIEKKEMYTSLNLPINDPELIEICKKECSLKGTTWCKASDITNEELIHRHVRRDRSEVISERNEALQLRQKKGSE